jgi:hypothetical protein
MTDVQRRAFTKRLDGAIDEAQAALRPLFDTISGAGVYNLPAVEQELLHEIMFKLGMLRGVIIHGDEAAENVHCRCLTCSLFAVACGKTDDAPRHGLLHF